MTTFLLDRPYRTSTPKPTRVDFHTQEMSCGKYAIFNHTKGYFLDVGCGQWGCTDGCAEKNASKLRERIVAGKAQGWAIRYHLILTIAEDALGARNNLSPLINDMITYLRKNGHPHLEYLWTKEFQALRFEKCGIHYRHIHIAVNQVVTKEEVIPEWNRLNHNHFNMVESKPIRSRQRDFGYLTKYLTKEGCQELFDKNERRYGASKDVLPVKSKIIAEDEWEFMTRIDARNLIQNASLTSVFNKGGYAKTKEEHCRDIKRLDKMKRRKYIDSRTDDYTWKDVCDTGTISFQESPRHKVKVWYPDGSIGYEWE